MTQRLIFCIFLPVLLGFDVRRVNCPNDACRPTKPYMCLTGTPHLNPVDMPINYTVTLYGDVGSNSQSEDTMRMLARRKPHLVLHAGDLSYESGPHQPAAWLGLVSKYFGNASYLGAVGNHDVGESPPGWDLPTSYRVLGSLAEQLGTCEGESGVEMVCTLFGMTIVLVAPGVKQLESSNSAGQEYDVFIAESFRKYPSKWRICVWHKNQRLMQVGTKADETGWHVYEECRRQGALVVTGHEHVYSRSYEMDSFVHQSISSYSSSYANPSLLRPEQTLRSEGGTSTTVTKGASVVLVVGTGGFGIRRFGPDVNNPWWAAAQAYETGLIAGGLTCVFNVNGESDKAYCEFQSAYSAAPLDRFWLKTTVAVQEQDRMSALVNADSPSFLRIQVNNSGDDVLEAGNQLFCDSPSIHLGAALLPSGLVPAISAYRFQDIPLTAADADFVVGAYISFYIWSSDRNSVPCSLNIQAEANPDSQPLCGRFSMRSRPWTNTTVVWNNVQPWDGVDENYRSGMQAESPNLRSLVREVLLRPGWAAGNSMTFFVTGTGTRSIRSFDMFLGCHAPTLVIEVVNKCMDGAITNCYFPNGYGTQSCINGHLFPCQVRACYPGYRLERQECVPIIMIGNLMVTGLGCAIPLQGTPSRLGIAPTGSSVCDLPQAMFEFAQQGPILNNVSRRGFGTVIQMANSPVFMLQSGFLRFQLTLSGTLKDTASGGCLNFVREIATGNLYGVLAENCVGTNTFEFQVNTKTPTRAPIFIVPRTVAPTPIPTPRTKKPTRNPTPHPTRRPTNNPTPRPTFQPTPRPTRVPTVSPTSSPSWSPTTESPTAVPTRAPTTRTPTTPVPTTPLPTTARPTTVAPTTIAPTTIAPTTLAPTTLAPTTLAPTTTAPTTSAPTTKAPTHRPTHAPTPPTSAPTRKPTTASPTATIPTTRRPSTAPTTPAPTTSSPTYPTPQPTPSPTTAAPTTAQPTAKPTRMPTRSPTASPTTLSPTTISPTAYPTDSPTTVSPTTVSPTTVTPTTQQPTTAIPTTAMPTTNKPTVFIPRTRTPTTATPTTLSPTTQSPTTTSPTTLSPITQSPTTETPTSSPSLSPRATQQPTTNPTSSPSATPTESPTYWPTNFPSPTAPTFPYFPPTASPVAYSPAGDFAMQFAMRLWPLDTAEFAAKEPMYREELAAVSRIDPKQVTVVSVFNVPGSSRRLLQTTNGTNETTTNGEKKPNTLEVHTSFINLDEAGSIQKVLLMKNAMASGHFDDHLKNLWPEISCEFAPTETPRSVDVSVIPSLIASESTERYEGEGRVLDLEYSWVVEQGALEMTLTAPTDGWVGFGVATSREGLMPGSDVILGWFEGERLHVGDYMVGTAREVGCPAGLCLDTQHPKPESEIYRWKNKYGQDNLITWNGEHTPGNTTITFKRPLVTQDPFDIPIGPGRTTVIFAYGPDAMLGYHGSHKGSAVIEFLPSDPPLSSQYMFHQKLGASPNAPTLYWTLTNDVLDLAFECQTTGYGAVGYSPSGHMVGSFGVVAWQHFEEDHVSGIALNGQTEVTINRGLNSDLDLMDRSLSFTNALLTARWKQRATGVYSIPLDGGHIVWASGSVDHETRQLQQHTPQRRGSAWVNFRTGPIIPKQETNFRASVQTVHAVLMGLAFCVCLPFGLAAPLVNRLPQTFVRGGFLIALCGFAVGVYLVTALGNTHFTNPHSILGLLVLFAWAGYLIFQFIPMEKRPRLQKVHVWAGVCVLLVGIITTYLGTMQPSTVDIVVSAGTSALILSAWLLLVGLGTLYLYCCTQSRRVALTAQDPVDTPFPPESSHYPMDNLPPPTPIPVRAIPPPRDETDTTEEPTADLLPYESTPKAKLANKYKDVTNSPADVQQLLTKRD